MRIIFPPCSPYVRRVLVHREGVISWSVRLHAPLRSLPSALLQLVLPVRLNTFRVAEAAERFLTFPLSHGSGSSKPGPEVFKRGDPPRRIKSCTESFPARSLPSSPLPPLFLPLVPAGPPIPAAFLFQPARYLTVGKRLSPLKSPHFCNLYFFH